MENFDLLFARVNDIGLIQQELKKDISETKEQQTLISKQVHANGAAVASLTMRQMDHDAHFDHSDTISSISAEDTSFNNIFAKRKTAPEPSKSHTEPPKREALPHHTLPKMHFPMFDGRNPRIWIDKCNNYFTIYNIADSLQVTAAIMHLEGNAAKWWQAYKQNHTITSWREFCTVLQTKFGADDFRTAITDLLALKQTGTVEEYTATFQSLQFDITMHNSNYDELFSLPSMWQDSGKTSKPQLSHMYQ